jgi:putative ABC transport system permease protein
MVRVRQVFALTAINLRNIPLRLGNSLVIVVGIAGVVAVLMSVLAMLVGFRTTIRNDGRPDRMIVLSRGATSEPGSSLSREDIADLAEVPGIRHDDHDRPLISAELELVAPVSRKRDHSDVNATMRGVGPQYFAVRPELKLIAGRMFHPGIHELVAGAAAQAQFAGLDVGDSIRLQQGDWRVVGIFAGGKGSRDSELVADAQTMMSVYDTDAFNSMGALLSSPAALGPIRALVAKDPTLGVDIHSEPEYLATESSDIDQLLAVVAYGIGSIMALGALFGALNSMHSAVAARTVEIATLRAIGFGSGTVALAILIEAMLLALAGAVLGVVLAYYAFNGLTISTLGGALFDTQVVYSLTVTGWITVAAVAIACALGLLGGSLPALRAARMSVVDALHEI